MANADLLQLWIYCLLRANHAETWTTIKTGNGETEVHLLPGQFIFGRNSVASALRKKPDATRKRILKLQKLGNCNIQSNTHYSIVTICNWDKYQGDNKKRVTPKVTTRSQPGNNQVTTRSQPGNTDNNVNNANNVNNENNTLFKKSRDETFDYIINHHLLHRFNIDHRLLMNALARWREQYPDMTKSKFLEEIDKFAEYATNEPKGKKWKAFTLSFSNWIRPFPRDEQPEQQRSTPISASTKRSPSDQRLYDLFKKAAAE